MYVITGSTGHIGRALAEQLLAKDQRVRVIGRSAERLSALARRGAEVLVADVTDGKAMTRACADALAVFAMIPPNYGADSVRAFQNKVAEAYVAALKKSTARHVVFLSSVGAHLGEKSGPVNGLHDAEQRLNKLKDTSFLHLRPGYFMENFLWQLPLIKEQGILGSALRGDLGVPLVATRDIAAVAGERLLRFDFQGHAARELLGPRDLTLVDATSILGRTIGRPDLKYVQFPYEAAEEAMRKQGLSPDSARTMIEAYRSTNEGIFKPQEARSPENTTPTTFETFCEQVLAPAYAGL